MLEFKNVSIYIKKNDRPLIEDFNFVLSEGDKFAIIGEEGNGKSTLLKIIYNEKLIKDYCYFKGEIIKRDSKIGYLKQFIDSAWYDNYVHEFFLKENPEDEIDYNKYNELSEIMAILSELNIDTDILDNDQKIGTLSGGEKVKIQLAKIISNKPDILLLDEPTNDLDITTLEWLEEFILNTKLPLLFISHDETILENVSTGIIHIEQLKRKRESRHVIEHVNYKEYVDLRINKKVKQDQLASNEIREFKEERKVLKQLKNKVQQANPGRTNRMNSLLSQEKKLENKELTNKFEVEEVINIKVNDEVSLPNGKKVIDFKLDELKINNKLLSENIHLVVSGPKKIGIIGDNGIGKTTLLNKIYDEINNVESLKLGYMPQDYSKLIDMEISPVSFLSSTFSKEEQTQIRTFMGSMKFTYEEMESKIKDLSGGQIAKLFILKMMISECNVLILDEPTRNLSPLTNPAIRRVLREFNGAIISVSHDRKFLEEVCDDIYELGKSGIFLTSLDKRKKNN